MAVRGNMHMDIRVIKVADFKFEVIWPPRLFGGRHALRGHQKMAVRGNMHIDTRVIKAADFKFEVIWPPRLFGGRHGL